MKYYYYEDDNGSCYVCDTTYSFADTVDLMDWAKERNAELEEVEAPEGFDANAFDGLVW